jgi:hypothetical protein
MEHVLTLYARPYNPLYPVVGFDEKSYQLLADSREALPPCQGHPRRQDYEYRRRGTRNLFIMVEPLVGQRHVLLTKRRTKADFAHAVRYLADVLYPNAKCIELVLEPLASWRLTGLCVVSAFITRRSMLHGSTWPKLKSVSYPVNAYLVIFHPNHCFSPN